MRLLFWGTPGYAVPSLDALVEAGHQLVGVVSQPDRRRGRGGALMPSAVKQRALELGLPVFTPARISREPMLQQELAALQADAYVVVAFGQILPVAVLDQPPLGCWNGHGSLLPRWRGAAPIQWSLIHGDAQTGVGIMAMEPGLDTGPVLLERAIPIGLLDNADVIARRLSQLTAALLVEALPLIAAAGPGSCAQRLARLQLRPQGEQGLTHARLLTKADLQLDWQTTALTLHRRIMGLYPQAQCRWRGQQLKVLASEPLIAELRQQLSPDVLNLLEQSLLEHSLLEHSRAAAEPGSVLASAPGLGLVVATGDQPLLLRSAQLQGRAASSGQALLQQLQARPGERLERGSTA